jgi:pentatricopeptide repeat protein
MRRLWHRFNSVPSQTRCIYCINYSRTAFLFPSLLSTSKAAPILPLGFLHAYSTSTLIPRNEAITVNDSTNSTPTPNDDIRKNKAAVLANFYRALSTQDIDRIWPVYTYLYSNDFLDCLTRKNYHNLFVYTIRSRACQKNLHRLLALVDDMRRQGYFLRLNEYNALIHWVGGKTVPQKRAHHLLDALKLFDEMQQSILIEHGEKVPKEPIQPDVTTFNSLIHIAAQLSDLRTAQKLYYDMVSRGLQPNQYTYSTLLHAMGKMGDVDGLDQMLKEIKGHGLDHLANTTVIWNVVMSGYACNGRKDRACTMFDQMVAATRHPKKHKSIPRADAESFRVYIDLMVHSNKREEALAALDQMKSLRIKPIVTIYNTLFSSFMKPPMSLDEEEEEARELQQPQVETIQKLYQNMKDIQVKPNSETMYTLVSAFLDLGDTKSALEVFVSLSNTSVAATTPTVDIQTSSIATLAKERLLVDNQAPLKIEPSPELLDRLNRIVAKKPSV